MAIRNEKTGTRELLRDALFHYAALLADPRTASLAPGIKASTDKLKKARDANEQKEEATITASALFGRAEFEIDDTIRRSEIRVLEEVGKQRGDLAYRAALPDGLLALTGKLGAEQAHAARAYKKSLDTTFPEVAKKYGKDLLAQADATQGAEEKLIAAEQEEATAFSTEILARAELTRTMQRSEAALFGLFPGQKARVRSYFRIKRRRAGEGEDPTGPSGPPVPT